MEYKKILNILKEEQQLINEAHVKLVEQILKEASSTTIASLPTTLQLKTVDKDRTKKLMDIIGAFVYPVSEMSWEEFTKKFGSMTMTEFMKKTKIDARQFAVSLSKTFPYINKETVHKLAP